MPPKKKGKKGPMLIDGVDTSTMSREQLEAFALRLKAEMEREREERNFFQLERDKLRTFWEITRNQLEDAKAEIRTKDRDQEITQELTDVDIKHVIQQMKHLQFENKSKVAEIRAEAMAQLQLALEEHAKQEQELLKDKRELKRMLRENNENVELQMQQLSLTHQEDLQELRNQFLKETKDVASTHEAEMENQHKELDMRFRMEMFEVEERKTLQIKKLIENHDAAFNDMKNYYNDITLNNLALISSLKDQMEELRKQAERAERLAADTSAENKKLVEPLTQAKSELIELRKKLEHYERDKIQLQRIKIKHAATEKKLDSVKWEADALLMRNEKLIEERQLLKNKFDDAVMELQQRTGLKNVLLTRKIEMLEKNAEYRETLLNEMSVKDGKKPEDIGVQFENLLKIKNDSINDLQYELVRVCKAHDDLLATYEAKLIQFGIPKEELGFEPLRTRTNIKYGLGPAGLVTKNC